MRAVQARGEPAEAGFGAYGYLLLPHAPAAAERRRHLRVCEELLRLTPSRDEVASEPAESLMVTHWLVKRAVDGDDCEELVTEYDHLTAARIARSVGKGAVDGPLLVAWVRPFEDRPAGDTALVWDLSGYSDEDLGRGIRLWNDRLARDPSLWQDGFRLARVRETIRNVLLAYDETAVTVVTSFLGLGN